MVYKRHTKPAKHRTIVVREGEAMDHRVVAEIDGEISIEQGQDDQVAQGLRFDVDEVDDLIDALGEARDLINSERDE